MIRPAGKGTGLSGAVRSMSISCRSNIRNKVLYIEIIGLLEPVAQEGPGRAGSLRQPVGKPSPVDAR